MPTWVWLSAAVLKVWDFLVGMVVFLHITSAISNMGGGWSWGAGEGSRYQGGLVEGASGRGTCSRLAHDLFDSQLSYLIDSVSHD